MYKHGDACVLSTQDTEGSWVWAQLGYIARPCLKKISIIQYKCSLSSILYWLWDMKEAKTVQYRCNFFYEYVVWIHEHGTPRHTTLTAYKIFSTDTDIS